MLLSLLGLLPLVTDDAPPPPASSVTQEYLQARDMLLVSTALVVVYGVAFTLAVKV